MKVLTNLFASVPELSRLLEAREHGGHLIGRTGRVMTRFGGVSTVNNLRVLAALIGELKPERTLEIGVGYGAASLLLAAYHAHSGAVPCGQHVGVDPTVSSHWDDVARLALERAGVMPFVDIREAASFVALPQMLDEKQTFNMVYIDGSHELCDVFIDFFYSSRLLAMNGILLFDDSTHPDVKFVLRLIRKWYSSALVPIDLSRYRSDSGVLKLRYKVARWLGKVQLSAYRKVANVGNVMAG